jgi:dTDP-4-amino-4,6-dideoxygalactose transaminase
VKLRRIDDYNRRRRQNARRYTEVLGDAGVGTPVEDGRGLHVYHQYTVRAGRRQAIRDALSAAGIASAVYYPIPLHRQAVYADQYRGIHFPRAEAAAEEVLSLPMYPELSAQQIDEVAQVVRQAA